MARPTSHGGWGIKHLPSFSLSLRMKSFWMAVNSKGIWNLLITTKYMKNKPFHLWLRDKNFIFYNASIIWKGFIATLKWIGKGISWQVGNGKSICLGADPIVGMGSSFTLPRRLREYLEDYGICSLAQARNQTPNAKGYWFSAEELDLIGEWKTIWENYVRGLEFGRIRLTDQIDSLIWTHHKYIGPLSAAEGYSCIISNSCSELDDKVLKILWTLSIPLKIKCFTWLMIFQKILT